MNKFILELFDGLRSLCQFFKILVLFYILMLILYWIQNLAGFNWGWLFIVTPILDLFIDIGEKVASGKAYLFDAVFEYKYFIALVLFVFFYAIFNFMQIGFSVLEDFYKDSRRKVRKMEEDIFNASMAKRNKDEQLKIRRYEIYVETFIKKKFVHKSFNVDLEEQNRIMNKYLIEKTSIMPVKHKDGFLYVFESFNDIDSVLDVFSKLLTSEAPLDYVICVQIMSGNLQQDTEQLDFMQHLKILNKIVMLADTKYRYSFNNYCRYNTSQVGLFQSGEKTYEVHEFN